VAQVVTRFAPSPPGHLHVGDDPITDVRGAREAGMRTIWFNPGGAPWPTGRRPDAEIKSLRQLDDALTVLSA